MSTYIYREKITGKTWVIYKHIKTSEADSEPSIAFFVVSIVERIKKDKLYHQNRCSGAPLTNMV